jgi:two-component system chemotaxis sensor kinase CheA
MVEAAGYRVVSEADEYEVDLAILSVADSDKPVSAAARVIRLRSEPDPVSPKDDTIYRYDRAGLLAALKSTARGRR